MIYINGWQNIEITKGAMCSLHCVPVNDLRQHYLDPDGKCWCHPDEDNVRPDFWHHNSADGRETYEEGRKLQ